MTGFSVNSSSSASGYYWADCNTYSDDGGAGQVGKPSAGLCILFSTYCFEVLVGTPSNLWLLCHIFRKRSKVAGVPPADFFPLHLAITQLFFYLILPLLFANNFLWQNEYVWRATILLTAMVLVMKPLLLCLVCVERYIAVVRPLDYLRFKTQKCRWGCLGVSWCIYILICLTPKHSTPLLCILFLPVLVIDTFCCLSVLKALKKTPPGDRMMMERRRNGEEKRETHQNRSQVVRMEEGKQKSRGEEAGNEEKVKTVERSKPGGKGEMNSTKRKAFITIAIIQAVLTLNYLPFIITIPMDGLVPHRTLKCQCVTMSIAAAASCTYLQPLLYLHRLGRLPCMTSQSRCALRL